MEDNKKRYTTGEEIANSVTHGIGAALAVAAIPLLVVRSVKHAVFTGRTVTSFVIYGVTLLFLYMMSTLYHALTPIKAKKVFGILDHSSIYALIAGTYTPFCLVALKGPVGWTLFGIIWGFAALGITFYAIFGSKMRVLSALTYIPMAWAVLFAARPLFAYLPAISGKFLIIGGIAYTVGAIFYALKKIKWMHSIFHIFCLAASICHFFAIYLMI